MTNTIEISGVRVPYRFEICCTCSGHGRSSAHMGSYTQSELADQGLDWQDDYFAGRFDRSCDDCDGTGKVKVADYSRMTPAQVAELKEAEDLDDWDDAEREAERRMGC